MDQPESRDPDDELDRRTANIVLAIGFVVIVGTGVWLANAMVDHKQMDDCIAQGRRSCGGIIEVPAR